MKRFSLIFGIITMMVLFAHAQDLKEIEGIYYNGSVPYSGHYTAYKQSGKPKMEMNLIDGMKDGIVKIFFENGELNEIRSFKKNVMDGVWITYNETNIKVAEARYRNGKKDGKWSIWNEEGSLIYELEYTDGEKTGIWKNYNEKGEVISERDYSSKE